MTDDEVTITIEVDGIVRVPLSDLWPDGDHPNPVTAAHVAALIDEEGGAMEALRNWGYGIDISADIDVTVPNPAWKGESTLPGIPAPPKEVRTHRMVAA